MIKKTRDTKIIVICLAFVLFCLLLAGIHDLFLRTKQIGTSSNGVQRARVVANGDILYHDILYTSVRKTMVPMILTLILNMLKVGFLALIWLLVILKVPLVLIIL